MDMVVAKIFSESMNSYICSTFLLSVVVFLSSIFGGSHFKSPKLINVVLWMLISCAWQGSTEFLKIIFYYNIEVQEGSIYYFLKKFKLC